MGVAELMVRRATIRPADGSADIAGVACWFHPTGGSEQIGGDVDRTSMTGTLYLPPGTLIHAFDRVVLDDGQPWLAAAEPMPMWDPEAAAVSHLEVPMQRVV